MGSKVTISALGLVTIGAIAFASFIYLRQSGTSNPEASPTPTSLVSATNSSTPSSNTSPSPSTSPSATTQVFSANQALTLPNQIDTIAEGGSLFETASNHSINVATLAKLNTITNPDSVLAGQTIIIPDDVTDNISTILFVVNTKRLDKEEQKTKSGLSSLYSDAISAARVDTKGIVGLGADTPYSKSTEDEKSMTLSTSDDEKIITVTLEKTATNLWEVKKMVIKLTKKD